MHDCASHQGEGVAQLEAEMKRASKEQRFEASALRDEIHKIRAEHFTGGEDMAEAELKAAFKPKGRPRQ